MIESLIDDILLTPLSRISNPKGDILRVIRISDSGCFGIDEVYCSLVHQGVTKGWKRHLQIPLNLVVLHGFVRFYFVDDRDKSTDVKYQIVDSSPESNYLRITVPPLIWVAFQGCSSTNLVANSIPVIHDPCEQESKDLNYFNIDFS